MKTITISSDRRNINFLGIDYPASCIVRTYESAKYCRRYLHDPAQVRYSMNEDGSKGKPVMPAIFPTGAWPVIDVVDNDEAKTPDVGPVSVRTGAHQTLKVWALDENGGYDHETDEEIEDYFYELHFDGYPDDDGYSVGCEHALNRSGMIALAKAVRGIMATHEDVQVVAEA